jgi:hypothetical protein
MKFLAFKAEDRSLTPVSQRQIELINDNRGDFNKIIHLDGTLEIQVNSCQFSNNFLSDGTLPIYWKCFYDILKRTSDVKNINICKRHHDNFDTFHSYSIGKAGLKVFTDFLMEDKKIVSVSFSHPHMPYYGINIGALGTKSIADVIEKNKTITTFELDYCSLNDKDLVFITGALKVNTTLNELNLANNDIGDEGMICLALSLCNTNIKILDVSENNDVTFVGWEALFKSIQKTGIETLAVTFSYSLARNKEAIDFLTTLLMGSRITQFTVVFTSFPEQSDIKLEKYVTDRVKTVELFNSKTDNK